MIDSSLREIDRFLHGTKLAETTVAPIGHALMPLLYPQPDRAAAWRISFLEESDRCEAPGWSALFATLHADALLRVGAPSTFYAFDTSPASARSVRDAALTGLIREVHAENYGVYGVRNGATFRCRNSSLPSPTGSPSPTSRVG
ncbi:hypothetical protein [Streptomyces sp. NPDC054786]